MPRRRAAGEQMLNSGSPNCCPSDGAPDRTWRGSTNVGAPNAAFDLPTVDQICAACRCMRLVECIQLACMHNARAQLFWLLVLSSTAVSIVAAAAHRFENSGQRRAHPQSRTTCTTYRINPFISLPPRGLSRPTLVTRQVAYNPILLDGVSPDLAPTLVNS